MKPETMLSTILLRKYHRILSTPKKLDTASASLFSESEEREEITADVPAPADILAPAPTLAPAPVPTLERVEEQSHTPGSRKSMRKNLGRPASTFSDFYM